MNRTRVLVEDFDGSTRRERRYATTSNTSTAKREVTVTASITGAAMAIWKRLRCSCRSYDQSKTEGPASKRGIWGELWAEGDPRFVAKRRLLVPFSLQCLRYALYVTSSSG